MSFKKQKIKKESSTNKKILNIVSILAIWVIFIFAIYVINNINLIKIKIDEEWTLASNSWTTSWSNDEKEEEKTWGIISAIFWWNDKKEKEENINILLTWAWWENHDGWTLTDSILIAKINVEKKVVSILSIPRDLYVKYPSTRLTEWRINWVYSYFSNLWENVDYWMNILKEKITEITGEKIDYYVNIDFNWFVELIDTIGWVTLEIPENFVDYEYPDWSGWYRTLVFRKWTWLFSWENALKYVRSRHSTSDFDRSLRQQKVITAIKDKLTGSFFLNSPWKIKELYDVFTQNVKTDISLTKIISLAYLINSKENLEIFSSNMNDSCFYWSNACAKWWILYAPQRELFNWQSVLLIKWNQRWNLSDYELSKKYSNLVLNFPKIEAENAKLNIFNSTKQSNLAWNLSEDIKKYGFKFPDTNYIWNANEVYEKSVIYYNNLEENSDTIQWLKNFFNWEFIETEFPKYSDNWAKIEIIIGQDYLSKNNIIFKF